MGRLREPTGQQKAFIDEYLLNRKRNATAAAIKAGYSEATASVQACQLLKNPSVSAYLKEREELLAQELREEFMFDAIEAREVMNQILKNREARDIDRITVARDFLDRAGFKTTDNVERLDVMVMFENEQVKD